MVCAGDTYIMDLPARLYLAHRLRAGHLPLWYPYDGLGVPLVGSLVFGVFHPFTLLYLVTSVGTALATSQVLLAGLAVLGALVLGRRLGLGRTGAAVAALGFGVGGPFVSALVHIQFATGISGLPWFLVGVHLALGRRVAPGIVLAATAFALAILGGDLQAAYLYGVIGAGFSFAVPSAPSLSRRTARLAAVAGLGIGLAAVQLLPTLRLAPTVYRAHGVAYDVATRWSAHPLRLPGLLLGDLLRVTPVGGRTLQNLMGVQATPWLPTLYLGATLGLGVVWALALGTGTRRLRLGLATLAGLLVLVAMGRYGGI